MREIRDSGKIVGLDRIAVMAALNLAHEVITMRARETGSEQELGHRLKSMRERVETSLQKDSSSSYELMRRSVGCVLRQWPGLCTVGSSVACGVRQVDWVTSRP